MDAELRRVSARLTKVIAERFGMRLGMWFGAGYPRSGTTWLCQLMAGYLDVPFPRRYRLPVCRPSVIHSHWLPPARPPHTIYVVRDGRDVLVSRYFYEVRAVTQARNPRGARMRRERFDRLYGAGADLADVRANLPAFIDAELTAPQLTGVTWAEHVQRWLVAPSDRVAIVRYEQLRTDAAGTLASAFEQLTGSADRGRLKLAQERYDFTAQQARPAVPPTRSAAGYLRRGVPGDWREHFSDAAREVFDRHAGDTLRRLGYPPD